jgi:hypothetical protein
MTGHVEASRIQGRVSVASPPTRQRPLLRLADVLTGPSRRTA